MTPAFASQGQCLASLNFLEPTSVSAKLWAAYDPRICLHSAVSFLHFPLSLNILLTQFILPREANEVPLLFPKAYIDLFLPWPLSLSHGTHVGPLKCGSQEPAFFLSCGACKQTVTSGDTLGAPGS